MDLLKLAEPFEANEIEWRLARCGKNSTGIWANCLAYINARSIMNRLDEVCGPENWKVSYHMLDKGIIAELSIFVDNQWVTKEDGAEQTEIESFKGGISSALKRAGAVWGVARYLYGLESGFATIVDRSNKDAYWGKTKEGIEFYWIPPELPDWALPKKGTLSSPVVKEVTQQIIGMEKSFIEKPRPIKVADKKMAGEIERQLLSELAKDRNWNIKDVQDLLKKKFSVGLVTQLTYSQWQDIYDEINTSKLTHES